MLKVLNYRVGSDHELSLILIKLSVVTIFVCIIPRPSLIISHMTLGTFELWPLNYPKLTKNICDQLITLSFLHWFWNKLACMLTIMGWKCGTQLQCQFIQDQDRLWRSKSGSIYRAWPITLSFLNGFLNNLTNFFTIMSLCAMLKVKVV